MADETNKPVDLTGPGFPPSPTEPAKPHTEEELNKLGQSLGSKTPFGLEGTTTNTDVNKSDTKEK